MVFLRALQTLLALFTLFWAAYVLAMPIAARLRRPRAPRAAAGDHPAFAVIVPAHNMATEIGACVAAIRAAALPANRMEIHVVADHCEDDTAARAREAGATAWERSEEPPGKTYVIAWTLRKLAESGADPDLYVVTDATARFDPGFLRAVVCRWRAGEHIIVGHSVVSADNVKWFARCQGLTLVHRNLQNWSRERLGLSALIEGRGMAYSRHYIRKHGWSLALPTHATPGHHPTEDWRHGVRIVEHGLRVAYEDDARVFTPLRGDLESATRQGIRWERGRQRNAASHGLQLLRASLRHRDRMCLFAALDAIQLPVAVLAVLCIASAALTATTPIGPLMQSLGYAPALLMALYGVLVTVRGRKDGISPLTLAWAPVYLLWRLSAFVLAWTPIGSGRQSRRSSGAH